MAKPSKPAAWALALAQTLTAGASASASVAPAPARAPRASKRTSRRAATASAEKAAKRLAKKISPNLAHALYSASTLPKDEPVWLACRQRLVDLIDQVGNETTALAEMLGITPRSAQRLRAGYDLRRRLVAGVWR